MGGASHGHRSGDRHRTIADPGRLGWRGAGGRPGRDPPRGRPALPAAHGGPGRPGRPPGRRPRRPGPAARPARLRRGPAAPCWWTRPGCTGSTTISCSSTRWWRLAATPPCCGWPRLVSPPRAVAATGVAATDPDAPRALALSTDGNARWCALDPRAGTALVVAESTLNVACVGARPVALVNCLNFGNPEHPEVMWQLSEAIDGMARSVPGPVHPGRRRQRQSVQREPGPRHRSNPGGGHAGAG